LRHGVVTAVFTSQQTQENPMCAFNCIRYVVLCAAFSLLAVASVRAQSPGASKPYSLEDLTELVRNGVRTSRVLELVRADCISFRMDDKTETRLRRSGADAELLAGLRSVCQAGSSAAPAASPPPPEAPRSASESTVQQRTTPARTPAEAIPARQYSARRAALPSLLLPGYGQFYTDHRIRGTIYAGAAIGIISLFVADEMKYCGGGYYTDPNGDGQYDDGVYTAVKCDAAPYIGVGMAEGWTVASLSVGLISAIDGLITARRANKKAARAQYTALDPRPSGVRLASPLVVSSPSGVRVEVVRLRF
jgi:TM2 domain-containing membrane protein YozV